MLSFQTFGQVRKKKRKETLCAASAEDACAPRCHGGVLFGVAFFLFFFSRIAKRVTGQEEIKTKKVGFDLRPYKILYHLGKREMAVIQYVFFYFS